MLLSRPLFYCIISQRFIRMWFIHWRLMWKCYLCPRLIWTW